MNMKLKDLKPCQYEQRKSKYKTLRETWNQASDRDKFWLISKCHSCGSMSIKELISLLLDYIKPVEVLMPKESLESLNQLRDWVNGEKVDLSKVRAAAYAAAADSAAAAAAVRRPTDADAAVRAAVDAAYVAYAAVRAAADAARASASADAAADAAYVASASADAAADAAYVAYAKSIELTIPISLEKVCEYLNLNINEVLE